MKKSRMPLILLLACAVSVPTLQAKLVWTASGTFGSATGTDAAGLASATFAAKVVVPLTATYVPSAAGLPFLPATGSVSISGSTGAVNDGVFPFSFAPFSTDSLGGVDLIGFYPNDGSGSAAALDSTASQGPHLNLPSGHTLLLEMMGVSPSTASGMTAAVGLPVALADFPDGTVVGGGMAAIDVSNGTVYSGGPTLDFAVGLEGDYSNDLFVSQPDLDLVLGFWGDDTDIVGVPPGWTGADRPVGLIGQAELDGVLINWGNRYTAPPPRPTQDQDITPVPEPGSVLQGLACMFVMATCTLGRRAARYFSPGSTKTAIE